MKRTLNHSYQTTDNSQEPAVDKEEITYESALRAEGIDEVFVARKLKDLLGAQKQRWNPKKGSWEKVDDHATQLAALREVAEIFGIYPKDPDDATGPVMIHLGSLMPKEFRDPAYGKQSVATAAGDGRERRERCRADTTVPGVGAQNSGV